MDFACLSGTHSHRHTITEVVTVNYIQGNLIGRSTFQGLIQVVVNNITRPSHEGYWGGARRIGSYMHCTHTQHWAVSVSGLQIHNFTVSNPITSSGQPALPEFLFQATIKTMVWSGYEGWGFKVLLQQTLHSYTFHLPMDIDAGARGKLCKFTLTANAGAD